MKTTDRKPSTKKSVKLPAIEPRLVVHDDGYWNVVLGSPETTILVEVEDAEEGD